MAIIEFTIHVDEPQSISALYDRIQVYRSPDEDGDPNPFVIITSAPDPSPAIIDGTVEGPWNLNGQSLTLELNGGLPVTVTFTESNPVLLRTVLDKLNAIYPTFAPVLASEIPTDTGKVRLTSPVTGTQSILKLSGTAATTLGLSTARTNGKNASLLLSPNTENYLFRDYDGQSTLWYKTRYLNIDTGAVSELSEPFQAGAGTGLSGSAVVTGSVDLADLTGAPIVGRRVIVVPVSSQVVADGGHNYAILPSVDRVVVYTDNNGHATVSLVKGQRVKVFLEGTTFQREFVVPTTDFDIMTVATTKPDPLDIVTTPPMPIRLS